MSGAPAQVKCRCGNLLAQLEAGTWHVQHRKRHVWARVLDAIRCEQCGGITQLTPHTLEGVASTRLRVLPSEQ